MVESSELPIVIITGVSGFLGSHVTKLFLEDGGFRVRGTVRSTSNEQKIEPLKKAFGENFDKLELVEADLLNADSLLKAIEGATYVVHTASPFHMNKVKNEDEFVKPALEGTNAVLKACATHKVKKLVLTSSVVSVAYLDAKDMPEKFTEENWSDVNKKNPPITAYAKSKTLAEKAAWDFQQTLPEEDRFDIVTICPGAIIGPPLIGPGFASGDLVGKIMMGKYPGMPKIKMGSVDVREVAQAHLNGVKVDEAKNQRFILVNSNLWFKEFAEILHKQWAEQGYKFKTKESGYCTVRTVAIFSSSAKALLPTWGRDIDFDNTKSKEILKVDYFEDFAKCLNEMAEVMIEIGVIPDKRNKA